MENISFLDLGDKSEIQTKDLVADKLVRGVRSFPSAVFYVDSIPLVWFSEPVGFLS